ncbi:winged helix-turn-helix transcriptional regulator [Cellulomonas triticagri]|uniref:Transcriptional regulator n=1 Tax=Cellulomonas triticagri TaxID=2483352 RepID=A0A3M2JJN5_9CELL|nr:helix-turn-helix domain-containing protein [Cellulomonas triticagri]RMI13889.1 transcriptional regulator [Cellulomonas triticagri]
MSVSIEVSPAHAPESASVLSGLLTGGVLPAACPSRVVLDHVTSKWGVLVLVALSERTLRWGELRRLVEGISEKMLASTLRTLEADGLVLREATPSIPPRVDYSLTPLGRELADHLLPLMGWITRHADAIVARG